MKPPATTRFDVLCAGIVVADHVCEPIARMPAAGELEISGQLSLAIGGCASNVAVDLRKLGVTVGVVGRIGTDILGRFVRETLQTAGVETSSLLETSGQKTSGTLVINVKGEDRRFIHAYGANGAFDGSEVTPELIRSARVLYLGGFFLMQQLGGEQVARMFQSAREACVITVLDVVIPDPGICWPQLVKVLPWTDVFLPNVDEGRQVTGLADPLEQAERFHAAGAGTVVITCGSSGSVLVNARQRLKAGIFPATFVDGTGSGDAFAAGYILGLLNGASPEKCLELGSALGSSCVRQSGATTGVFTRAELDEYLKGRQLEIESLLR